MSVALVVNVIRVIAAGGIINCLRSGIPMRLVI